jgi:hypothetical protein
MAGDGGCFNTSISLPYLDTEECAVVMEQVGCFEPHSIPSCAEAVDKAGIGIKQLLMVIEMAKQTSGGGRVTHDSFVDCLHSYGL